MTMPRHPFTGELAIGLLKNGRPIWPVKGGAEDGQPAPVVDPATDPVVPPVTDPGTDPAADPADPADLGDAGKKALAAERAARKAAEKASADKDAELARLRRGNAAVKGTDLDAIKAEIRAEFSGQLAATAIRAEAKGRLTDPADTARYPEYFKDVDSSDDAAVKAAVDKLLEDKPYLAVASGDGAQHWGDVGAGQRSTTDSEPTSAVERMERAYGKPKTR